MEQSVSREILWNVSQTSLVALYVSTSVGIMMTFFWFLGRIRLHKLDSDPSGHRASGSSRKFLDYIFGHRMIRRDPYAGIMHLFLFWGFFLLLVATTLVGIQHHLKINFLYGLTFILFSLMADFGGLIFCAGVIMALRRRQGKNSLPRLRKDGFTLFVLYLLLFIGLTGFFLEGLRITRNFHSFEMASPIGYLCALLLKGLGLSAGDNPGIHRYMWNFHAILVVVFFLILPYSIMKHIVLASVQVFRSSFRAGRLSPASGPFLDGISLAKFSQADLREADACLTCGRCDEVCPANLSGKPLKPRTIVSEIRKKIGTKESGSLTPIPEPEALWSCTTCHACDEVCPVHIQIMDKIVNLRRGLVSLGEIPLNAASALESGTLYANPFGQPNSSRMDWAGGLRVPLVKEEEREVSLLYWVGCAGSFDPDGREVSKSMVTILNHLNITYRVLGCEERCTGDPIRRLGEEGLWKELAEQNIRKIRFHGVRTILTHCPHCFNAFLNEYEFGATPPRVLHHSEWLREQLDQGTLRLIPPSGESVTWHDPCYLSRSNDIIEEPRQVISKVTGEEKLAEMRQSGKKSLCCGGGGGQLWLDVKGKQRVESLRSRQVEETGATTAVTGCPFCKTMLTAGKSQMKEGEGNWKVKDLAQLVCESLQSG